MPSDRSNDLPDARTPADRRARRPAEREPELVAALNLAFEDDLTGLRNRRFVTRLLWDDWQAFVARHREFSLILIDLDGFKAVNDTYGHLAGDGVLKAVGRLLCQHFRESDVVARYGGDEFLVVLPDAGETVAAALADRARAAVDAHVFSAEGGERIGVPLSFSVGVAAYPPDGRSGQEIVAAADRRLYAEKRRRSDRRRSARTRTARGRRIRSLAVLPLQNLNHDPQHEYFVDGMTEELITELARIGALRVISRGSVMAYKGVSRPVPVIAGELGVDAVVEGSVLRDGERVRITAQLIHGTTDEHLWAESYDRTLREVLDLQRDVAQAIAGQIHVKLSPRERARLRKPRPVRTEVYELYLKGRFHWNRLTLDEIQKAIRYFEQALQMDPRHASSHAALADCYNALQFLGTPEAEVASRAREAALKSVECDPAFAGAHGSLGTVRLFYDWDWEEAEREFQRALALDPSSAGTYQGYAYLSTVLGRHESAIAAMKRARGLDPLGLTINVDLGWRYFFARQHEHAIRQLRQTLELDPSFGNAYWCLGCAQVQLGDYAEAIDNLRKAVGLYAGSPQPKGSLGHAYALAGDRHAAVGVLAELKDLSHAAHVSPWVIAVVHAGLGDAGESLAWLERAYEERVAALAWLKVHPELDPVRTDPRFVALLDRMRFPD